VDGHHIIALLAAACSSADRGPDSPSAATSTLVPPTTTVPSATSTSSQDLLASTPEEQGIDSVLLAEFVEQVVAVGGIDSVTVDEGLLAGVDVPVGELLPDAVPRRRTLGRCR
jgi:hypothetical protein